MPTKLWSRPGICALIALLLPLSSEAETTDAPDENTASIEPVAASVPGVQPVGAGRNAATPQDDANQVIDSLHASLLDVMRNATDLGYEGRFEKLEPVISRVFDVEFMARKSVGRYWKQASAEEQQRFLNAFKRFMVANYAGQFDAYSGQSFETLGMEPARMETVLVRCVLIDPTDKNVELNYRMRQRGGRWRVIDVYLDGTVSELALRRSEFSSIVKNDDFDALIAAIDEKIAKLASDSETS
jgi:phospholipid transport system substrate-binding protein